MILRETHRVWAKFIKTDGYIMIRIDLQVYPLKQCCCRIPHSVSMQLNIGLTEPEFRLQTAVFPIADSLSTNSATASKTGHVQSLAGMARQFSTISYSFMPKENTIRFKKGQFALGDGRLMLLSTKTEQVHLEKLA